MFTLGKKGKVHVETILKPGGADTSKLSLTQLQYVTKFYKFSEESQQNYRSSRHKISSILHTDGDTDAREDTCVISEYPVNVRFAGG